MYLTSFIHLQNDHLFCILYTSGMVLTSQRAVEAMEGCVNDLISREGEELNF